MDNGLLRQGEVDAVRDTFRGYFQADLHVVNDGVLPGGEATPAGESCGSGLRNLAYRVEALDGELTAGVRPDGTHRLCAVIPLAAPAW